MEKLKSQFSKNSIHYSQYLTDEFHIYFATKEDSNDSYSIKIRNNWKIEPQALLANKIINMGDTFIDLGANIGAFCLPVAINKKAKCYAVEALDENVELLAAAVRMNNLIDFKIIHAAVYDSDGFVNLSGSSAYATVKQNGEKKVRSLTLDSILKEYNITTDLALLKMDIEGCEIKALNGAKKFFQDNKDVDIIFEANGAHCFANGYMPQDLLSYMESLGYNNYMIFGNRLIKRTSRDIQEPAIIDYIATKKELKGFVDGFRFDEMNENERISQIVRSLTLMKEGYRMFMLKQLENTKESIKANKKIINAIENK